MKPIRHLRIATVLLFILTGSASFANITLPKIFTSNMVLQRDKPIQVWGWALKGEQVTVRFNGQTVRTRTDNMGQWSITLKGMPAGGPHVMQLEGKNRIDLANILLGDVYVCSGQSNMEWTMRNTNDATKEIQLGNYPKVRLFTVPKATSFTPSKDFTGGEWLECNPQNLADFSAVAYYFGRKLNEDIDVPIGLINTSWGGTNIQAWISWDQMGKKPGYQNVDFAKLEKDKLESDAKMDAFRKSLLEDKGDAGKWYDAAQPTTGWKKITLPTAWEQTEIGNADGNIWFRKDFELDATTRGAVQLSLGPIDDKDITWVNGVQVGSVNSWNEDRVYDIDPSLLKTGKNTIVVKVTDTGGGGGIYGKPEQLYIMIAGKRIPLHGEWLYRISALNTEYGVKNLGPNEFPSQLYNAMIAPIIRFPLKGGIWYQGESNTWQAHQYRSLFPEMINDWRSKWRDTFPFFWVQLANFMKPDPQPVQSDWAELREAQSMTLNVAATGQAVIIDIGEENDIHPRNKKDVGIRLALAAERLAYGKDVIFSGPVYKSMRVDGDRVILEFNHIGSGLVSKDKYGYLKGFAIAGDDQKFKWAQARIEGDKVIVFSNDVKNPVAVRYAWGNNPDDANLYNKEMLPASPFRTDNWPGITEGK